MAELTSDQLARISPLGAVLLDAHRAGRLPPSTEVEFTDRLLVRIPAAAPQVGDLEIVDDGDEYTVYVGHHTHYHVMTWLKGGKSPEEAHRTALDDLLTDLKFLLSDKTVIWSTPRGNGGTFGLELGPSELEPGAQAWLWSGRPYP